MKILWILVKDSDFKIGDCIACQYTIYTIQWTLQAIFPYGPDKIKLNTIKTKIKFILIDKT